jgi:hypothetical protein
VNIDLKDKTILIRGGLGATAEHLLKIWSAADSAFKQCGVM